MKLDYHDKKSRASNAEITYYINKGLNKFHIEMKKILEEIENDFPEDDRTASTIFMSIAHNIFIRSLVINIPKERLKTRINELSSDLYRQCMEFSKTIEPEDIIH